ncbi:hypothetical protein OEZ86_011560 [Tetradesmus obliquus]|nr:hypothetical protein OEZ86_011560 [Tetradesmus obliquus]
MLPREYKFQVQVPVKGDETKLITVGKADLDLSFFVLSLGQPQSKLVPIMFKVGAASTGYLKLLITAEAVAGDIDEDGMTEVSGMTGVAHMNEEQDLSGFNEEAEDGDTFSFKPQSKPSPTAAASAARKNSRFAASPTTAAAAAAADEPKPWEAKGPGPSSRRESDASSKALAAAAAATAGGAADDDGDISPMSLSPSASTELSAEAEKPASRGPGKPRVLKAPASRLVASVAQVPVQPAASARQAAAGGSMGGHPDSAASRQLAVENEKLRAQMVALREQAVAAEDARRQARLAAENAAAERDEYRGQAEELQQQLKEAIVGMVTAEEAADLERQECELHTDELDGQVAELTRELQATQELLQLQQEAAAQLAEAAKPPSGSGDVPALSGVIVELRAAVAAAEQKATVAEKQRDSILEVLLKVVQIASQLDEMAQHMADSKVVEAAQLSTAVLADDPAVQGALLQVVVAFRAALAAAAAHHATEARLADKFTAMKAMLDEVQAARKAEREQLQLQQQQQPQQQQPVAGAELQVIALADSAGPSGMQEALSAAQAQLAELQRQLAEGEAARRGLEAELARLRRQLAEEQSERGTLEEQLAQHLEESEDFMAQDAVAAYEAKYNRLKTRYRELTEAHREEVDGLHEEIAGLQERLVDLEAAAAQLEAARSQAQHGEATLAETLVKSSKASSELAALRIENQSLMQELIARKLALAQCAEREVVGRRELYKAKETNMKLASKMTRLEVQMYKK